jgi:hypothetical protein
VPALFEEFVTGLHFAFNGKAAGHVDMFIIKWIGLRENLNRKPWIFPSNMVHMVV